MHNSLDHNLKLLPKNDNEDFSRKTAIQTSIESRNKKPLLVS